MRIWFFERNRFEEEYARRRAKWSYDRRPDDRQFDCLPHDVRRRAPDFVIDSRSGFSCATASHPAQGSGEIPSKRKSLHLLGGTKRSLPKPLAPITPSQSQACPVVVECERRLPAEFAYSA
jgi:hypothetical protein